MALTQQWKCLNLTRNSFYILFPAKVIVSYRQVISSRFYVRLNKTCPLASRALYNTRNRLNNANVNYLEMPKKHRKRPRGPHAVRVFQTSALQSSQYSDKKVAVSQIVFTVSKVKS